MTGRLEDLRPRPLEVCCGLALGGDPAGAGPGDHEGIGPRAAVDVVVARALARPPCLVSFSGGRDSSSVLAAATTVARREGFPPPIPATYRFARAPGSQEDEWQEQVVRHLGVEDWIRVPITDELDAVGPVAQTVLRRHGLLWPFNAYFHAPLLDRATGGSLLTGIGGDELFGRQIWSSARAVIRGRGPSSAARARSVALAMAPRPLRRRTLMARSRLRFPWLRTEAERAVGWQLADWRSRTPVSWRDAVGWWWRSRSRTLLTESMDVLAEGACTDIINPFLEPSVVGATARHFGRGGPSDRAAAMATLFGDLLPAAVLARTTKAFFDEAVISDHTRAFGAGWLGTSVDEALVDPQLVATEWRSSSPDPRSLLLMQAAWLATQ